jgi:hypothetical protein
LQHGRVFGEDISIDAPQMLSFSVVDNVLHKHPAEPVTLKARAHQDREFGSLFIELVFQSHEAKHVARNFVERNESRLVPVVEMGKLVFLCNDKLGNALKEAKLKIAWADIAQEIRVYGLVLGLKRADQHALAAPHRFVHFRCGKVAFVHGAPPGSRVEPYVRYSFAKMADANKIMLTKAMNATVT